MRALLLLCLLPLVTTALPVTHALAVDKAGATARPHRPIRVTTFTGPDLATLLRQVADFLATCECQVLDVRYLTSEAETIRVTVVYQ